MITDGEESDKVGKWHYAALKSVPTYDGLVGP